MIKQNMVFVLPVICALSVIFAVWSVCQCKYLQSVPKREIVIGNDILVAASIANNGNIVLHWKTHETTKLEVCDGYRVDSFTPRTPNYAQFKSQVLDLDIPFPGDPYTYNCAAIERCLNDD